MPSLINCSKCGLQGEVPDDFHAPHVDCPRCKATVPLAPAEDAPSPSNQAPHAKRQENHLLRLQMEDLAKDLSKKTEATKKLSWQRVQVELARLAEKLSCDPLPATALTSSPARGNLNGRPAPRVTDTPRPIRPAWRG